MVATRKPPPNRPRLRPGRDGYRLDDREYDGFPDQISLPETERIRIARWGRATGWPLSAAQEALLAGDEPEPTIAQIQTREDERHLTASTPDGLFGLLSAEQAQLVRQPSLHPDLTGATYPLSVGQLATLAGASQRQIRHWSDLQLLRTERSNGDRRFWPAATAAALVLTASPQHVKATCAEIARGAGTRSIALLAEALLVWSQSLEGDRAADTEGVARALGELAEPASTQPSSGFDDDSVPSLMSALKASLDAVKAREGATAPRPRAATHSLTSRERDVLRLFAEGAGIREIAAELAVSTPQAQILVHRIHATLERALPNHDDPDLVTAVEDAERPR